MSLLLPADSSNTAIVSVFSEHLLHATSPGPLFRAGTPYYWPVVILFLIFGLYVFLYITNTKKLLQVFLSVYSNQASKQLYREDYRLSKNMSVILSTCFILVLAFLVYVTNQYFGFILQGIYPLKQFLFFAAVVTILYIIKTSTNYFVSFATQASELMSEYTFNVFISSQALGIVLLPLAVCIQFSRYPTEWFLYPAIIICAVFYLLRTVRGFIISVVEQNIGIVYVFLYLCALEILPLLVLIKFLLVNF